MINYRNLRNVLVILAVTFTPDLVAYAYARRGYFAIGGEILLVPLIFLSFELLKSLQTIWRENYGKRN